MELDSVSEQSYRRWIQLESRHRLLVACFVLDMHRQKLFQLPATQVYPHNLPPPIPRPCAVSLWTAKDATDWYAVKTHRQLGLMPYPPFAIYLEHAISLHQSWTISPSIPADPVASTVQLATLVPVQSLLITASSSWLFARKVDEVTWRAAMDETREWIMNGPDTPIAAWLAGKMLRSHFFPETSPTQTLSSSASPNSLEMNWCLYLCALVIWAYTFPVGVTAEPPQPPRRSSTFPHSISPGSLSPAPARADTLPPPSRAGGSLSQSFTPPPQYPGSHHPTSHVRGTPSLSHPERAPRTGLQPLAAGPPPPPPSAFRIFLDGLATHQWMEVVPLQGRGGADCVLEAVARSLGGSLTNLHTADAQLTPENEHPVSSERNPPNPARTSAKGKGKSKDKATEFPRNVPVGSNSPIPTPTLSRARIVEERGAIIGEAVGVLYRLRGGRGIWWASR